MNQSNKIEMRCLLNIVLLCLLHTILSAKTLPLKYGLELHLAADQLSGLQNDDLISTWTDLSPQGRHATQTSSTKKPVYKTNILNGKPVVRFDGVDDFLSFSECDNIRMVFWVIKENVDGSANNRCILGHSGSKYFHRGYPKQIWSTIYTESQVLDGITKINGTEVDGTVVDVPTEFSIISIAATNSCKANQLTRDRAFSSRVWNGDIAEIIVFSRILTYREENEVGAYLQEKYSLTGSYPSPEDTHYVPARPGTGSLVSSNPSPLLITMDLDNVRQKILNFGASDCWSGQYVGNWPNEKTNGIADLLFSTGLDEDNNPKGIGLSLWRYNLGAGSARQNNIYDHWRASDFFYNTMLTDYDWSRCSGQRNLLQLAKRRGVDQFTAFCNSPMINMTKNGYAFCDSSVGSTNLATDKHDEFAVYLADVLEHFRDVEGIDFTYISPFNEPEWDWNGNENQPGYSWQEGCRYSNQDMQMFVSTLAPELLSRDLHTDIEICESGTIDYLYTNGDYEGNHAYQFYDLTSTGYIGDLLSATISSHSYWTDGVSNIVTKRQNLRNELDLYGLNYAQTEFCILGNKGEIAGNGRDLGIHPALWTARTIHNDLVVAEAQSWQWWLGISPYDYKDGLVYVDKNDIDGNYYESKLLWGMGNFSRFIRPGMHRIELQRSDGQSHSQALEDLMVSGYYSFAHDVAVIVFVNYSFSSKDVQLDVTNFPTPQTVEYWIPYVTAGDDIEIDSLTPYQAMGEDETFAIPPRSIVTMVGMPHIDADCNLDRDVTIVDLIRMGKNWLAQDCSNCDWIDTNNDNIITMVDLGALSRNWLTGIALDYTHLWSFSEGTGEMTLEAINQTYGSLVNMSQSSWVAGHDGSALDFSDANDFVNISDINLNGQWTLMFWAKGNVSSPYYSMVLGNPSDTNNYLYLRDDAFIRFRNSAGVYVDWSEDVSFYNKWRHITLVGRDDTVELFLDGTSQGSQQIDATLQLYTLGAGYSDPLYNYNGILDEVRLYDRALTPEEIINVNY